MSNSVSKMHVKARSPFLSDLKSDEVSLIGTKEEEPWHGFHWLVVSFRQIIANERQYTFFILCRFSVKQCVKVVWILDPIRIAQRFERSSRLHVCFDHESKGGPSPYSHRNSVNHESVPLPGTHYLKYIVTNVMNYRGNTVSTRNLRCFECVVIGEICRVNGDWKIYLRWN